MLRFDREPAGLKSAPCARGTRGLRAGRGLRLCSVLAGRCRSGKQPVPLFSIVLRPQRRHRRKTPRRRLGYQPRRRGGAGGPPAPRCVTRLSPRAGAFVCKMVPFVQSAAVVTEVLTMTCIAVERHRGLVRPFRRRWQSTPRRACAVLGKAPRARVLRRARLCAGLGHGGIRGVRSAPRLPPPSARLSFGPSPALENSLSDPPPWLKFPALFANFSSSKTAVSGAAVEL